MIRIFWKKNLLVFVAAVGSGLFSSVAQAKAAKSKESQGGPQTSLLGVPGTVEFEIKGFLDFNSGASTAVYADMTLGYVLFQGIETGVTMLQGTTPTGQRDTYGLFAEYDWVNSTRFVPFAGAAVKHAAPARGAQVDARQFVIDMGINYVLTANTALSGTFSQGWANQPAFGPVDSRNKTERTLDLGLRLFF